MCPDLNPIEHLGQEMKVQINHRSPKILDIISMAMSSIYQYIYIYIYMCVCVCVFCNIQSASEDSGCGFFLV